MTSRSSAADLKVRMIRSAAELFHARGLGATSPEDVVRASGAKTRQFYHYFKNKQGIVHEVLRCYLTGIQTGTGPVNFDVQSWQDLKNLFFAHLKLQQSFGMTRSCPLGTIATGVTENDEQIRQDLCLIFEVVAQKLAAFFVQQKAKLTLSERASGSELADFCIATMQGAMLIGKITRDSQPVESAIRVGLAYAENYYETKTGAGRVRRPEESAGFQATRSPIRTSQASGRLATGDRLKAMTIDSIYDEGDTKLSMIGIAADLFHKQGVAATSPGEILEASRTGKSQFYYYFTNKEDIVHEVLQSYLGAINSNTSPINYRIESWRDMEQWFSAHIEFQKRFAMTRGCPFGTIGNEITEHDTLIQRDLSLIFETIHNKLAAFFIREKAKGRLSKDAKESDKAYFCIAAIQGAMLLGKVRRNARIVESVAQQALVHVRREIAGPLATARRSQRAPER